MKISDLGRYQYAPIGALLLSVTLLAQPSRILGPVEPNKTVQLRGNVHPNAQPRFDQGRVDQTLTFHLVTVVFKSTLQQQGALQQLLSEQQDRSSPEFRQWLTPEEYADQFGLSREDIAKISQWLTQKGSQLTTWRAAETG